MNALDRFLTVVVTATLTSAAWILFGSTYTSRWIDEDPAHAPAPMPAQATPEGEGLLVPVAGIRPDELVDSFADERGGGARMHEALDIMAPRGTAVVAAAPGTIERLFRSEAGGNTIYVRSEDRRTIYYYAHLDAYAENIGEGAAVRRGQMLGTVGSSGNASEEGPHLHFAILRTTPEAEWWEPATAINPYPLLAGN